NTLYLPYLNQLLLLKLSLIPNGDLPCPRNSMLYLKTAWLLVPPDCGHNVVGCKWIFRIKRHADGSVQRYKARLVAQGYNQRPGIDFVETFSPVVRPVTIRIVLTLAVTNSWPLLQLDVNNAFLHGHLQEVVYMKQPPGFVDPTKPTHVYKLVK